jgi:rhodanese-related sulfurtransferase/DNA-directed RNA polymerase subunit RPC12/RpoP
MKHIFLSTAIIITLYTAGCINSGGKEKTVSTTNDTLYTCLPCGYGCDTLTYTAPGTCSHCNMKLVEKATVKFGTLKPEDICGFITQKGADSIVLLDVRTPEEFNGTAAEKFGRLANAVNIPVQQLPQRIHELEKFKNSEIIVYCSHSHRSPAASYLLNQNGFAKVSNMAYGMSEWQSRIADNSCNSNLYIKQ